MYSINRIVARNAVAFQNGALGIPSSMPEGSMCVYGIYIGLKGVPISYLWRLCMCECIYVYIYRYVHTHIHIYTYVHI